MKRLVNERLAPGSYLRGVATLMSGTVLAHGITIAATPILTRLYEPSEFGILALFLAIANLIGVAACGRYEMAIVLPDDDDDAVGLLGLSLAIALASAMVSLLLVALLGEKIANWLASPELGLLLWLLPVAVLARGFYQALNFQATREKHFRRVAASRVGQSGSATASQIAMATAAAPGAAGLAGGYVLGLVIGGIVLLSRYRSIVVEALSRIFRIGRLFSLARRYKAFPLFDLPASLLNTGTYELPVLLLGLFFLESVVGEFGLAMRVVALPSVFISASLAQVFYQRANQAYNEHGHARDVVAPSLRILLYLALPCYLLLGLFAPWLFELVFGEAWREAGVFAAALTPLCFFMFLVAPVSQLFLIYGKQNILFRFQLAYFIASAVSFATAGFSGSPLLGVVLFSALGSLRFATMLVYMCRLERISPRMLVFGAGVRA